MPLGRRAALLGAFAGLTTAAAPAPPPIELDTSRGRCLVPVLLDGRLAHMQLDTGAEMTVMTRAAVARLGLRPDNWVATTLRGAGGRLERYANVDVRIAQAGGVALVQRLSGGGLSLPVTSLDLGGADGLLGGDVLRHYTLDLDIPRASLMIGASESPAADAIKLTLLRRDLLLAPVTLNGHALVALLDTGATASIINARGLYRLGLLPAQTLRDPVVAMQALGGPSAVHIHRFDELRIGPLKVPSPTMLTQIVPEPAYDLVLGLDVLGRQRLLLSYPALTLQFANG